MNAGDVVYVLYHGDPGVYHTRLLAEKVEGCEWVMLTPDKDIYVKQLGAANVDISSSYHAPDGRIPRQLPVNQACAIANMDARQYGDLLRAGRHEAGLERARRGLPAIDG